LCASIQRCRKVSSFIRQRRSYSLPRSRERLGLPAWQPGDEIDRRIPSSRRKEFDQMETDREAEYRPRSEDDIFRIKRAAELWRSAKTREELQSRIICGLAPSSSPMSLSGPCCAIIPARGETKTPA